MIIDFLLDDIRKAIAELEGEVSGLTAESFASVDYVSSAKTIYFYNAADEEVGSIDTTDFVVDGMIDTVSLSGNVLHFVFNTDAGKQPIDVDLSSVMPALDEYWTSAETKDYVDSASTVLQEQIDTMDEVVSEALVDLNDHIYDVEKVTASALTELHDDILELSGATPSTEEIELPIAAAVNELKGDFEARLNQKYYTRQEVNDIAARKTEPGQVNVQIQDYVDPAIAEVNDTIENKELPVSAALNELNQKISEISGGSGGDMSAYWTSAQTEEAISAATAGKADVANISGRTQESDYYYFPWFNNQGIITGDTRVYKETMTIHMSDATTASANLFKDNNYGIPGIYVASKPGTAGQIAKSDGYGFTWANDDKVSSTSVSTIWKGTQAEYDAITTKDPNTFYIIVNN